MSSNLADVCPVGALNHGPTAAYTVRPYELMGKQSIDLMDSLRSNTYIEFKQNTIIRIWPQVNEQINEQWLADKSRQAFDGLKRQRLLAPFVRKGLDFVEHDWQTILPLIAQRVNTIQGKDIACGIGQFESIESIQNIQALKDLLNSINCFHYQFRSQNNLSLNANFRTDNLFNSQIQQIEDTDIILLVGVNPKTQAPVLNSRMLKTAIRKTKIYFIRSSIDLTYPYENLGFNANVLQQNNLGNHPVASKFKVAKFQLLIVGRDALTRSDSAAILQKSKTIANTLGFVKQQKGWNGFNVLHRNQGQINALELGIQIKLIQNKPKILFLLGCDNYISPKDIPQNAFVVYIGSFGDQGVQYGDVILPTSAYTQRSGTYVNIQGRVQLVQKFTQSPGHSRDAWQIIRALSQQCGVTLDYNSIDQLRARSYQLSLYLYKYNHIEPSIYGKIAIKQFSNSSSQINNTPFVDLINNYYMTDAISRNSITMAKCSYSIQWYQIQQFWQNFTTTMIYYYN